MATKAQAQPKAETPTFEETERAKDREIIREERRSLAAIPAADVTTAALRTTFLPQSMAEAMQFAAMMSRSNFVPGHLRGKDGDCMAVVMISSRWGMDPFAVANKTYFTKEGAPAAFEAQLVNAVVNSSSALSGRLRVTWEGEGEKLRCTVRGFLKADPGDEKVRTLSIARVTTRNSPLWKTDPEQQLAYYLTRAWARLYCPEVLMGVYTPDELDIEPERARNITPPMPRRDALPDIEGEETFDQATGEIGAADSEEVARTLDNAGFAEMRREDPEAPLPTYQALVDDLLERLTNATVLGDVIGVSSDFEPHREGIPDDVVATVDTAIATARARFRKPAA